ncbi:tetratricopeptide repeat protein, partial [Sulfuricurvum sp.]|uniref:tetratricopeptide repeat protein n=1 Tax=Sulfuricurvum sp. TaxID=2025608 RepID=UPI003BB7F4F2
PEYLPLQPYNKHVSMAFSADWDIFAGAYEKLKAFDSLIVLGQGDHVEMKRIFPDKKIFSYCLGDVLSTVAYEEALKKDIDVLVTGNAFHPLWPDKVVVMDQIVRYKYEAKIVVVERFFSKKSYLTLLSRSKIAVITHARRPLLSTRGVEALYAGCIALVPEDEYIAQFFSEKEGVFVYNNYNIETVIERILNEYDTLVIEFKKVREKIEQLFAKPASSIRFLKFCYIASLLSDKGLATNTEMIKDANLRERELCEQIFLNSKRRPKKFDFYSKQKVSADLTGLFILLKQKTTPSLVLCFNALRMSIFADDYVLGEAIYSFLIEQDNVMFTPESDDILDPVSFDPEGFDYDAYSYYLVEYLKEKSADSLKKLKEIVYASIHYYGALCLLHENKSAESRALNSIALHPDFGGSYTILSDMALRRDDLKQAKEYANELFRTMPYKVASLDERLLDNDHFAHLFENYYHRTNLFKLGDKKSITYMRSLVERGEEDFFNLLSRWLNEKNPRVCDALAFCKANDLYTQSSDQFIRNHSVVLAEFDEHPLNECLSMNTGNILIPYDVTLEENLWVYALGETSKELGRLDFWKSIQHGVRGYVDDDNKWIDVSFEDHFVISSDLFLSSLRSSDSVAIASETYFEDIYNKITAVCEPKNIFLIKMDLSFWKLIKLDKTL